MTIISLDAINWHSAIENVPEPYYDYCYRIGGLLSAAYRRGVITAEFVNKYFCSPNMSPDKKEPLCRGYLFWQYGSDAEQFNLISRVRLVKTDPPFPLLFRHLNDENIRILLPFIEENVQKARKAHLSPYFMQLLEADTDLFKRIWHIVSKEKTDKTLKQLCTRISHSVKKRIGGAGLKKRFIVISKRKLSSWLQGDLRCPLIEEDPKKTGKLQRSESGVLSRVARIILPADLQRVWRIMEKTWPTERLLNLGNAFLYGLRNRAMSKFQETNAISDLISKVEKVVEPDIYLTKFLVTRVLELSEEFSQPNPFHTWMGFKALKKDTPSVETESFQTFQGYRILPLTKSQDWLYPDS